MTEQPVMMTTATSVGPVRPPSISLVVFTDLEGRLRDEDTRCCDRARGALALLSSQAVPVVIVTRGAAGDVISLQRALDLRHPFVCNDGAAVYVPRGYFPELQGLGSVAADSGM